jgi:hypothetical protein
MDRHRKSAIAEDKKSSFLKKRTKKLLPLVPRTGDARCAKRRHQEKSFLLLFFKKEALSPFLPGTPCST